jgi:hypothetical protein
LTLLFLFNTNRLRYIWIMSPNLVLLGFFDLIACTTWRQSVPVAIWASILCKHFAASSTHEIHLTLPLQQLVVILLISSHMSLQTFHHHHHHLSNMLQHNRYSTRLNMLYPSCTSTFLLPVLSKYGYPWHSCSAGAAIFLCLN